ncbi:hypothetical protein [Micromonospora sp. IBHARD004]|uniref:hypothetical protein n=1 Tax=Micromonospora sp. IBHARD004 TaxID=3457764 RepID=UPI0040589248
MPAGQEPGDHVAVERHVHVLDVQQVLRVRVGQALGQVVDVVELRAGGHPPHRGVTGHRLFEQAPDLRGDAEVQQIQGRVHGQVQVALGGRAGAQPPEEPTVQLLGGDVGQFPGGVGEVAGQVDAEVGRRGGGEQRLPGRLARPAQAAVAALPAGPRG